MSARDAILGRIRASLHRDDNSGAAALVQAQISTHALSPRSPADRDLIASFRDKAQRMSTTFSEAGSMRDVPAAVATYLRTHQLPMRAVCWKALRLLDWVNSGVLIEERPATPDDAVGITEVFCAIAETGTLMLLSGAQTPAVTSLLPETHIAVLRETQIVPAIEEAWQRLRYTYSERADGFMPRAVNFVSGPSRKADIEQTVTLGAHGPYRVHIVLLSDRG